MSTVQVQPSTTVFPDSNVQTVVSQLLFDAVDVDARGLVQYMQVMLARAEDLQSIFKVAADSSRAMLAGDQPIAQETVNAQVLHTLYETRCLKWFLACACRSLADSLEEEVRRKQERQPRVRSVVYGSHGEVESFQVERT
jgi:hypothetical protein